MAEVTPEATAAWRARTIKLLFAIIPLGLSYLVYDFFAYEYGGQDATITQVLRDNSAEWALIPVLLFGVVGLVAGHIWWGGGPSTSFIKDMLKRKEQGQ